MSGPPASPWGRRWSRDRPSGRRCPWHRRGRMASLVGACCRPGAPLGLRPCANAEDFFAGVQQAVCSGRASARGGPPVLAPACAGLRGGGGGKSPALGTLLRRHASALHTQSFSWCAVGPGLVRARAPAPTALAVEHLAIAGAPGGWIVGPATARRPPHGARDVPPDRAPTSATESCGRPFGARSLTCACRSDSEHSARRAEQVCLRCVVVGGARSAGLTAEQRAGPTSPETSRASALVGGAPWTHAPHQGDPGAGAPGGSRWAPLEDTWRAGGRRPRWAPAREPRVSREMGGKNKKKGYERLISWCPTAPPGLSGSQHFLLRKLASTCASLAALRI